MHFCIVIITKEFPTDDVLEKILAPYNEEDYFQNPEERPAFLWDYWMVGGRYKGRLKLNIAEDNESYEWKYYASEPRAGRLFRHGLLEAMLEKNGRMFYSEEDYYGWMGSNDEFLYVDGGKIADMRPIDVRGYMCIDAEGNLLQRITWNGAEATENTEYDLQVQQAIQNCPEGYICIVDIHE